VNTPGLAVQNVAAPARACSRSQAFAGRLVADGQALDCAVWQARTFAQRARGLLWFAPLAAGEALWIPQCPSIHTVGMAYAIDVLFLDAQGRVLRVAQAVGPLRFRLCRGAVSVIELLAGQAQALGMRPGQHITTRSLPSDSSTA
jgi:hypothetical protein